MGLMTKNNFKIVATKAEKPAWKAGDLLTLKQAGEILSVSETSIRKRLMGLNFSLIRLGVGELAPIRVLRREVEDFLNERTRVAIEEKQRLEDFAK